MMSQDQALASWKDAWKRIVYSQVAPTFLLITTVGLLQFGLAKADYLVRLAALLVLLASGILGAIAQFSSAADAIAAGKVLNLGSRIQLLQVVKFVTPAIFVVIFVVLAVALLWS
ncbi:MAG: hypothetical protein RIS26_15 [Actinomycetota bacterium]|jgi:hypothetical protein